MPTSRCSHQPHTRSQPLAEVAQLTAGGCSVRRACQVVGPRHHLRPETLRGRWYRQAQHQHAALPKRQAVRVVLVEADDLQGALTMGTAWLATQGRATRASGRR